MSARAGPGDREHDRAPPDAQKDQLEELARPCIILCSKSASSPHGVGQANSTRDRLTTQQGFHVLSSSHPDSLSLYSKEDMKNNTKDNETAFDEGKWAVIAK